MKYCNLCKKEHPEDLMFCPDCGKILDFKSPREIYDGNTIIKKKGDHEFDINKAGVFKIVNKRTKEVYVSFSRNMELGILNHIDKLKSDVEEHHNIGLQSDYDKGDRFDFIILEETDNRKEYFLKSMVRKWIKREDSFNYGYNRHDSGGFEPDEYFLGIDTGGRLKDKEN